MYNRKEKKNISNEKIVGKLGMEELIMVGFWALDQLGRTGIKVSCFDMT
jgi:hypothetical protein